MVTPEEIEKAKQLLRSRRCPCCGEEVKHYLFAGVSMPFESLARLATYGSSNMELPFSVYFVGMVPLTMFVRLSLTSTCKKGFISNWDCTADILSALLTDEMYNDGYYIETPYTKEDIENMLKTNPPERYRVTLEKLLNSFESKNTPNE